MKGLARAGRGLLSLPMAYAIIFQQGNVAAASALRPEDFAGCCRGPRWSKDLNER
jgi:hypothetical protein